MGGGGRKGRRANGGRKAKAGASSASAEMLMLMAKRGSERSVGRTLAGRLIDPRKLALGCTCSSRFARFTRPHERFARESCHFCVYWRLLSHPDGHALPVTAALSLQEIRVREADELWIAFLDTRASAAALDARQAVSVGERRSLAFHAFKQAPTLSIALSAHELAYSLPFLSVA